MYAVKQFFFVSFFKVADMVAMIKMARLVLVRQSVVLLAL